MLSKFLHLAAVAAILSPLSLAQNDDCTGALPILDGANGPFTTVGATTSAPIWSCAAGGSDLWYSYVATATGTCVIDACGGTYDTALEVFDGTAGCGGLVWLACNDDSCNLQSRVTFQSVVGTTYYVRLGGYSSNTGTAPINVTPPVPPQPNTLTTNYYGNSYATSPATFFFDLTVVNQLLFTSMDVNLESAASTPGTIDVYSVPTTWVGNDQNPAAWTLLGSGTVTAAGPGLPSTVTLGATFMPLAVGTYGIAIQYNGVDPRYSYQPTPVTYTTPELQLVTGAIAYGALGTVAYTQYEWNGTIRYQPATGSIAQATSYGAGCYDSRLGSFYEVFPFGTFDLSGSSFQMIPTGDSYYVTPGSTNWFTPVAANLGLFDDSVSGAQSLPFTLNFPGGSTNSVWVSSNGFVWLEQETDSGCCNGVAATLLSAAARICAFWGDLNPSSGGTVHFDVDPTNTEAYVTWVGVPEFGQSNTNTFQIAFFNSGIIEVRFQTCSNVNHTMLTGFSMGHDATDPNGTDLSTAIPATFLAGPFQVPLTLTAGARPLAGTTVPLTLSNLPNVNLGLVLVNFSAVVPGLDLGYLGMPGCTQHIGLGGAVTIGVTIGNGVVPVGIPVDPAFYGFHVFAQAAALVPGVNALGGLASNGVRLVFGNV